MRNDRANGMVLHRDSRLGPPRNEDAIYPPADTILRRQAGIRIRASANMWRNPMTSVPADGEANLSAGRPIVRKNMSVPHTTAVLRMPTRDTGYIQ
jgi:hypothetical protein